MPTAMLELARGVCLFMGQTVISTLIHRSRLTRLCQLWRNQLESSFLNRIHDMSYTETGYWLGLVYFIGAIGTFLGGFLGDQIF